MPVDYRQLESATPVDTSLPDSGASARAQALAQTFREFNGLAADIGDKYAAKAGAIAGAASGATGTPDYKTGLTQFTAYSTAYNNAATRSYLVEATATAAGQAETTQLNAGKDPDQFRTVFGAIRDATVAAAPPQARGALTDMYNEHLTQGYSNLVAAQQGEILQNQRNLVDLDIGISTNKISKLNAQANTGDADAGAKADDEWALLSARIDGAVNTRTISVQEGQAKLHGAHVQVFEDTMKAGLERELQVNPDPLAGIKYIQKFQEANRINATLPEAEEKKVTLGLFTDLKEYNLMVHGTMYQTKSAEDMKYEAGDRVATEAYLQGFLTPSMLTDMVHTKDLKSERATGLSQLLLQGPRQAKSDPIALRDAEIDPQLVDKTDAQILAMPGISAADQTKLIQKRDAANNGYEGKQWYKDGQATIYSALHIPPGTPTIMLTAEQRAQLQTATEDYRTKMGAADPAAREGLASSIASDVITGSNTRIAADALKDNDARREAYIHNHGPGSTEVAPPAEYERKMKFYDSEQQRYEAIVKKGSKP